MDSEATFPLSPSQEIIWLHERLAPGSRTYNFVAFMTLRGELDESGLRMALAQVLQRNPGLRLELSEDADGAPTQRLRSRCAPRYDTVDVSARPDTESAFLEILREEAEADFDEFEAPLLRWRLVRLADQEHRLIHVEHHLIHDGRSFLIIVRDLFSIYRSVVNGEASQLPKPVSYLDHLAVVADGSEAVVGRADFWARELNGANFVTRLSGLTRPGAVRRNRGAQLVQVIPPELSEQLRARCVEAGHTVFTMTLGLFAELVRRHCGRSDLVLGTAVANRPDGYEDAVGMFINTVPVRLRMDTEAPCAEALDEVTETLIRILPYQDTPIQRLTQFIGRHTSGADNPLFNIAFSSVDEKLPEFEVPGLDVTLMEGFNSGTARFDLDVIFFPDSRRTVGPRQGPAGMQLKWNYDADVFPESAVRLLITRFDELLAAYVGASPEIPLSALAGVPPTAEPASREATYTWDLGATPVPQPPGRRADAPVLTQGSTEWTVGVLRERVEEVVWLLTRAGVGPGQVVAVLLPPGVDAIVVLLACLHAGFVYCPFAPAEPAERRARQLRQIVPALVVGTMATRDLVMPCNVPVAVLGEPHWPDAVAGRRLDGIAAIVYTAGYGGEPAPVTVSRTALNQQASAIIDRYGLAEADRVLVCGQLFHHVALGEILAALAAGAYLVIASGEPLSGADLVNAAASSRVTVSFLATGHVLAAGTALTDVLQEHRWSPRLIVLGGEPLPARVAGVLRAATEATILNTYRSAETGVVAVYEIVGDDPGSATSPVGYDLPGVRSYVLDETGRSLPSGCVGEIAVAGAGIADGYLPGTRATASRFGPAAVLGESHLHRTGDRGYRDTRGRLNILGRFDEQLTFRGYRIDPGEIQTALLSDENVREAHIRLSARPGRPETDQLVAYVVPHQTAESELDITELRSRLASQLPAYLIPGEFVVLPALPRSAGGRVNLAELVETSAGLAATTAVAVKELAEWVAGIWAEALGVPPGRIGWTDNFFDIGGYSRLLLRVHARITAELGYDIPGTTLFRHPTVLAFSKWLAGAELAEADCRPDPARRSFGRERLNRVRARSAGTSSGIESGQPTVSIAGQEAHR